MALSSMDRMIASRDGMRKTADSLNIVDENVRNLIDELIDKLAESDMIAQDRIDERRNAIQNGNKSQLISLDEEIIKALEAVEKIERDIVTHLSKNVDFDTQKDMNKIRYIMSETEDKELENKLLDNKSLEDFKNKATDIEKQIKTLTERKDKIEKELQELKNDPNANEREVKRRQRDLEQIEKELKKLNKQKEIIKSIGMLDDNGIKNRIRENQKAINHNKRTMKAMGINPNNYAYATDMLEQVGESRKIQEEYFPTSSIYKEFEDMMTAEEFYQLSKYYQAEKGVPLRLNQNKKGGLLEAIMKKWNSAQIKAMIHARYPDLDKNSPEFERVYKEQKDTAWDLMQSGVTPLMLRDVYRAIERNIDEFEKRSSDRSEWLRSLRIDNEQEHAEHKQDERVVNPGDPERKPDGDGKPNPNPEKPSANDFLQGLEIFVTDGKITKEQAEAIIKANPKNIVEFNYICIELGITFGKTNPDRDMNPDAGDKPDGHDNPDVGGKPEDKDKGKGFMPWDRGLMYDNDKIIKEEIDKIEDEVEDEKDPSTSIRGKEKLKDMGFSQTLIEELNITSVEELIGIMKENRFTQEIVEKISKKACTNLLKYLEKNNHEITEQQRKMIEERKNKKTTKNLEFPGFTDAQLKKIEQMGITSYKELMEKLEAGETTVKKIFTSEKSLKYAIYMFEKNNKTEMNVFKEIQEALAVKNERKEQKQQRKQAEEQQNEADKRMPNRGASLQPAPQEQVAEVQEELQNPGWGRDDDR